jgi:hypothetical protein
MPTPRTPDRKPDKRRDPNPQLGNEERGRAHWPLDLEIHPDREEEEDRPVTHPLNPPPERRSTRRAEEDERPGS